MCAVYKYPRNQNQGMGLLLKSAILLLAWWAGGGSAMTACSDNIHCFDGFYCENFTCRKCLNCKDFKREAPSNPASCIMSVVECGPCLKGLVVETRNDVNAACAPPQTAFGTTWIVTIIVVAVVLFLLGCVFILYILRNKGKFKMHAYLGASVESQSELPRPSAPAEQPPPYVRYDVNQPAHGTVVESGNRPEVVSADGNGTLHPPPQPQSRASSPYDGLSAYTLNEEASQPFIKRASPPPTGRSRASAGLQDARVFNRPAYVYPSYPEPTYSDAVADDAANVHDEDTVESSWTPAQESADSENASAGPAVLVGDGPAGGLSAQLDAARGTVLVRPPRDLHPHPPPAKKKCFPHAICTAVASAASPLYLLQPQLPKLVSCDFHTAKDSNNNGNQSGSGEPSMSGGGGGASASGTTTAIKVNMQATLQLNTLHQHDSSHRHPTYKGESFPR